MLIAFREGSIHCCVKALHLQQNVRGYKNGDALIASLPLYQNAYFNQSLSFDVAHLSPSKRQTHNKRRGKYKGL